MRTHCHITLADCTPELVQDAAKLVGGKATQIDLEKPSGTVSDMQVTVYGDAEKYAESICILKDAGFHVVRVKIEAHAGDFFASGADLAHGRYMECHIPEGVCVCSVVHVPPRLQRYVSTAISRNARADGKRFLNIRAHGCDAALWLFAVASPLTKHVEVVLSDSNTDHDADWWAGK